MDDDFIVAVLCFKARLTNNVTYISSNGILYLSDLDYISCRRTLGMVPDFEFVDRKPSDFRISWEVLGFSRPDDDHTGTLKTNEV